MKELINRNLVLTSGLGPQRKLSFCPKKDIWHYLVNNPIKTGSKVLEIHWSINNKNLIESGESALSKFSDLSQPSVRTVALTKKHFESIKLKNKTQQSEDEIMHVEVRKEDPGLFSVNGCLNPIELFFELRTHPDERVQISLSEMLNTYDLEVNTNE